MRMIGSLDNAQQAKRLAAYLLTEGIKSQMEEEGSQWEIWIKDEDLLDRSKSLLSEFRQDPENEKYREALRKAESIQREEEKKRREYQKNLNVGTSQVAGQKKAPMTLILIGICGLVALVTNFGSQSKLTEPTLRALLYTCVGPNNVVELFKQVDDSPIQPKAETMEMAQIRHASIFSGQVWRLVTPIFIHHGPIHLLFNMIWLFQLGRLIENRYGTFYFAILVLVIAAVSNFAQCAVPDGVGGSVPVIVPPGYLMTLLGGMSGVVFGLLGFIWVKSSIDPASRMFIPNSTIMIMLAYMVFCMTPMAADVGLVGVANWAHGIGLLAGLVAGYLLTMINK